MTFAFAVTLILGLALVLVGLFGRRVGNEPRCRRCKFDLSGHAAPGAGACPECGADLSARRALRTGLRKRRWRVLALGCVALAPVLAAVGLLGYSAARTPANQPGWLLLLRAEHGPVHGAGPSLDEIELRHGAGTFTGEQVAPIVDRALKIIANDAIGWNPTLTDSWSGLLIWAIEGDLLTAEQLKVYVRAAFDVQAVPMAAAVEDTVRIGVRVTPSLRAPVTTGVAFDFDIELKALTINGVQSEVAPPSREPDLLDLFSGERPPRRQTLRVLVGAEQVIGWPEWSTPAPEKPGVWTVDADFEISVMKRPTGPFAKVTPNVVRGRTSSVGSTVTISLGSHRAEPGPASVSVAAWSQTATTRVRVTRAGGVITPIVSDAAVNSVERGAFASLQLSDDQRPSGYWQLSLLPADVGFEFDLWLVTPDDDTVRASCVMLPYEPMAVMTPEVFVQRGWSQAGGGYHGPLVSTPKRWWARSDPADKAPFDPSDIEGEGWRFVLQPRAEQWLTHAPKDDPTRDGWTPPRTLARRVVLELREVTPEQFAYHRASEWPRVRRLSGIRTVAWDDNTQFRLFLANMRTPNGQARGRLFIAVPPQKEGLLHEMLNPPAELSFP